MTNKKLKKNKDKKHKKKGVKTAKEKEPKLFEIIDAGQVPEKLILRKFIDWCAIPSDMRVPKKHREFALENGIDKGTLSRWKRIPRFFEEVDIIFNRDVLKYAPDVVYYGWVKPAKGGNPKAADSYMTHYKGFKTQIGITDTTPKHLDAEALAKLKKALGNKGKTPKQISIITEGLKDDD